MVRKIVTTRYIDEKEGFEYQFEPIEDTLKIKKTKAGYEARYLIQENDPQDPREDENLGTMVCFHKRYTLGDKTDLTSEQFDGWKALEKYLIEEKNAVVVLPLYMYDHSGISIATFRHGQHASWDCGQIGFIYATKEDIKRIGIKKSQVEKSLIHEVEYYNKYVQGDCYCLVKETYNAKKEYIDHDTLGGFFGYSEAVDALETEI